ncbi:MULTISPECIES: siderophore-interacting protein [unclassified Actinopolyspora]|uniref:SIP domain-containing protein n=1 Tax=Actinopolyspora TaxID=1849 RepID=UPI0013F5B17B|nr:siderophore-interacting protein [Actinopolyspora sp. BKK2]NHE78315.1 siderophore-interacting protein [Actinopolyspora sp. BKK1]
MRSRYRQLEVREVERLTPRVVRVVLGGEELADFVSSGTDQRIKLCLPRPGMPTPLGDSREEVFAAPREQQPKQRTYTVRWFDARRRELAVDLVLHEHEAPGASWAANVRAGDRVVTVGPSPSYYPAPEADPLVLVGDESALPAITAILEELPGTIPVKVFVEVADSAERAYVPAAAPGDWAWLFRDTASADGTESLPDAVSRADLGPNPHVWVGAEADVVHRVRRFCETELGLGRSRLYALAYWRSNRAER